MQGVILAGGLGTRLAGTLEDGIPKPMAPIAGRPFLEHQLEWAIGNGVDDFVLLVGHGHLTRTLASCALCLDPSNGRHLSLDPAALSIVGTEHAAPALRLWNDVHHLAGR